MNKRLDPHNSVMQQHMNSPAVLASLPKLEDLPEANRRELIEALAALLMQAASLQLRPEVRHEPEW